MNFIPFRCHECGQQVQMVAKPGRTRLLRRDLEVPIPDDFELPTCTNCGEEYSVPEVSEKLDAILETKYKK